MKRALLALLLLLAALPALAASYVFPGTLPAGCSGTGPSYTCGALSLGYNDTVTFNAPTPATLTINGAFSTNTSQINNAGTAANLSLVVNGAMTVGYQTRINANITATSINDTNGQVMFGGSLATTTGSITIGYASTVAGSVTSTSGAISVATTAQLASTVSCSCALTVGYQARISGNVSATSMTDSNGQVTFGGSVATSSGALALGYASTVAGGVSSCTGTINLGGTSRVAQCVQSAGPASLTVGYQSVTSAGVCCGTPGSCSSSCVVNNSGGAMPAMCASNATPAVCAGSPSASTAGRFGVFDTGTAAGSLSGVIHTKVAGTAFSVAVVAVNTAGTGLATAFAGAVKVELLDSSDSSGAMTGSTGCRSTWAVATGTTSSTLTFAASDLGRKNVALTVSNSWRDARVRVSYPATGTPTAVGCSNDSFAIRPASFASFSATDATYQSAGTTRTLTNTAITGGNVHKAGQPFTLRATAVNGAGSPAATTNYTGTPTAFISACTGAACGGTAGTLTLSPTATLGVINTTASYAETGAFSLQLVDSSFAAVDVADGSTAAEMNISSPTLAIGRFVPDHFEIQPVTAPILRTFNLPIANTACTTRSFTYFGQPFGYETLPRATVLARNANNATTQNYAPAKLAALVLSTNPPLYAIAGAAMTANAMASTVTIDTATSPAGTASLTIPSTVISPAELTVTRSPSTPQAALFADISLTWGLSDLSESGTPITTTTALVMSSIAFNAGATSNEFRYGVLKLSSAYGSELINLAVPLELQYWNGSGFATNSSDQCTSLPLGSVALANYRSNLSACETAPGPSPAAGNVTFSNGRGLLRMLPPGSGNTGSVDATLNLGATATGQQCSAIGPTGSLAIGANMPWLQGRTLTVPTFSANPSARISFGQYRSPLINAREVY